MEAKIRGKPGTSARNQTDSKDKPEKRFPPVTGRKETCSYEKQPKMNLICIRKDEPGTLEG